MHAAQGLGAFLFGSNHAVAGNMTMDQIVSSSTAAPSPAWTLAANASITTASPKVLCVMEAPDMGTLSLTVPGADSFINYQSFMSRSWPDVNSVEALLGAS
jgi:hypothetical protein